MKPIKHLFFVLTLVALVCSCKNENNEASTTSTANQADETTTERSGQAFIEDDEGRPTVLSIAIGSPDHTTLVAAVQAAQLENALVNAGPLMVFAPTNEAFAGLMSIALITGLLYGRFSKPKAAIKFSKNLILRDFNHTRALMFRLVNSRKTIMIYPKIAVTLSLSTQNNLGDYENSFYSLNLERDTINYLPTTWTIVHKIDKESPFFEFSNNDLIKQHGELLVMISYYDESFNQEVHQMHSYVLNEIKLDCKFVKAYYYNDNGQMVLDYKLFDTIESVKS